DARIVDDAYRVPSEEDNGKVAYEKAQAEGCNEGHHLALQRDHLLVMQLPVEECIVECIAYEQPNARINRSGLERRQTSEEIEKVSPVRAQHDEFPVCYVDDLDDSPNYVQPMSHD